MQDTRFLIDELVEVGTRALSPGVNDPFTAISCLDWLGAALSEAARRQLPSRYRADEHDNLRVVAPTQSFQDFVDRALGNFRQYLATDKLACLHAFRTIERVAVCATGTQVRSLAAEVDALSLAAREALEPSLAAIVQDQAERTRKRLEALA